jgi:hypothetical protein
VTHDIKGGVHSRMKITFSKEEIILGVVRE